MVHLQHVNFFLICGGLKFVVFFNFVAFSILCKKLWNNSQSSDICGVLTFVTKFAA